MDFEKVTDDEKHMMIRTILDLHPSWKPKMGQSFKSDVDEKVDKLMSVDVLVLVTLFRESITFFEIPTTSQMEQSAT